MQSIPESNGLFVTDKCDICELMALHAPLLHLNIMNVVTEGLLECLAGTQLKTSFILTVLGQK